jgi:hypothetical protein
MLARIVGAVLCSDWIVACGGQVAGNGGGSSGRSASSIGVSASGQSVASGCMILASNYDQSCAVDTDCVEVAAGDYCSSGLARCPGSAINVHALAQFNSDIAKTPLGQGAWGDPGVCEAIWTGLPSCCRQGTCQWNSGCAPTPGDILPACSDAGGICILPFDFVCDHSGPPDACAYADETCCLSN